MTGNGVRERAEAYGVVALSDVEVLNLVLGPGVGECTLAMAGTLHGLLSRRAGELAVVPGVGGAKALRLLAAIELGKRVARPIESVKTIAGAADVWARCTALAVEQEEIFVAIGLNSCNHVVGEWVVARGWESGINLTPRQVFTLLVKERVSRVVFVHNHPSGDPTPSPEDVRFTARLLAAAKCLDIRVLDHVVVAAGGHASIREHARNTVDFD